MGSYIVCLVTIDDLGKAVEIAEFLVKNHLVACVNILPEIQSIYLWKGKLCDEREKLMVMKTRKELFDAVQAAVKKFHLYEVPEIISLDIDRGLPEYFRWIDECTPAG